MKYSIKVTLNHKLATKGKKVEVQGEGEDLISVPTYIYLLDGVNQVSEGLRFGFVVHKETKFEALDEAVVLIKGTKGIVKIGAEVIYDWN